MTVASGKIFVFLKIESLFLPRIGNSYNRYALYKYIINQFIDYKSYFIDTPSIQVEPHLFTFQSKFNLLKKPKLFIRNTALQQGQLINSNIKKYSLSIFQEVFELKVQFTGRFFYCYIRPGLEKFDDFEEKL